jgi:hypothetical protein
MKISTIFRRAAKYLTKDPEQYGCCNAIRKAVFTKYTYEDGLGHDLVGEAYHFFSKLFEPEHEDVAQYYFEYSRGTHTSTQISWSKALPHRVNALLFAAEIAESEGL